MRSWRDSLEGEFYIFLNVIWLLFVMFREVKSEGRELLFMLLGDAAFGERIVGSDERLLDFGDPPIIRVAFKEALRSESEP
jgi:hypothetical protein